VYSQSTWQKSYGTPTADFPRQMIALTNGGYLFTGQSYTSVPGIYNIAYLANVNANGDSLWTREIFPILPDSSIIGLSVFEVNPNLFLLGSSKIIFMYDSNGNQLWFKKIPIASFYQILDYINGEIIYTTGAQLQKVDTSGLLKWSIDFPNFFGTKKVIKNRNNNYCYLYPDTGGIYFREITFSGQIIKDQLLGIGSSIASGLLIQDSKQNYVEVHGGSNTVMVKFDTLLNILSEKIYSGFNEFRAFSETPDKGYILTGMENQDIAFLKIDSSGNQEYFHWLVRWFYEEFPIDIHVDTDGGFVVFGSGGRDEPNYSDYLLVKTNRDATLGIPLMPEKKHYQLIVYPNPTQSVINIKTMLPITGGLIITDLIGRTILKKEVNSLSTIEINVDILEQGLYVVQFTDQHSHKTYYQKFFKN
jgi:hypothetical protein